MRDGVESQILPPPFRSPEAPGMPAKLNGGLHIAIYCFRGEYQHEISDMVSGVSGELVRGEFRARG